MLLPIRKSAPNKMFNTKNVRNTIKKVQPQPKTSSSDNCENTLVEITERSFSIVGATRVKLKSSSCSIDCLIDGSSHFCFLTHENNPIITIRNCQLSQ
eukprot:m.163405 g.163405  ORF g.163405 m.163405 type:complete len:98 (-) comp31290_c0_seq4:41-334(-)